MAVSPNRPVRHRRLEPGDLERLNQATSDLDPPFALVDLDPFWSNADDLVRRAGGKPIRVASKSIRCRALLQKVLAREGFRGVLAFTVREAVWLAGHGYDDVVIAYPSVDRAGLRGLAHARAENPDLRLAVMVDSVEQLDHIDAAVGERATPIQVCIDIDAGLWLLGGRLRIGAKRSPVHTPEQAATLARHIVERAGFRLIGLMAYESQIAGVGDAPPRRPVRALAIRAMQRLSVQDLAPRRAAIVDAVRAVAPLELVNGGGTGSLDHTGREACVTEVAAGSGMYGPALFDSYRWFRPRPSALFALPVVRRPRDGVVTVLGGGYLASGPADDARLPQPHLPPGLRFDRQEGAGEVQTPLLGATADMRVGDRVFFRHAKAGELCERFDRLFLVDGFRVVDEVPTYRGEGHCFL